LAGDPISLQFWSVRSNHDSAPLDWEQATQTNLTSQLRHQEEENFRNAAQSAHKVSAI
jgi:hypothetical protein